MGPVLLTALILAAQDNPAPAAAPAPAMLRPTEWPLRPTSDDYPAAALRNEEQGQVNYRIEIGPDGRVARCTITSSSGSASLDSATCRIVTRRARFAPARDSQGNPVPDARDGEVIWRLGASAEETES